MAINRFILLVGLVLVLSAFLAQPVRAETPTPAPTSTPQPTSTPFPSWGDSGVYDVDVTIPVIWSDTMGIVLGGYVILLVYSIARFFIGLIPGA